MESIIPKSPTIYNYFYEEPTEVNDILLYKTQKQEQVLKQLLLWKQYKTPPPQLCPILFKQIKDYSTIIDVSKI